MHSIRTSGGTTHVHHAIVTVGIIGLVGTLTSLSVCYCSRGMNARGTAPALSVADEGQRLMLAALMSRSCMARIGNMIPAFPDLACKIHALTAEYCCTWLFSKATRSASIAIIHCNHPWLSCCFCNCASFFSRVSSSCSLSIRRV